MDDNIRTMCWGVLLCAALWASPSLGDETVEDPPEEEGPRQQVEVADPDRPRWHRWELDDGLWFKPTEINFRVKFGTQLQLDTAGFVGGGDDGQIELEDGVDWRRARVYAHGYIGRRISFKFQWGFAEPPRLKDAWLSVELPKIKTIVRGGRFSSTFGLENDGSSNDTMFMEQGLTGAFVPPQETGVLFHSSSNRQRWDLGVTSAASQIQCLLCNVLGVAGRYSTALELGSDERLLHLGFDYSRRWRGEEEETVRIASRPESHIAPVLVDTGHLPNDRVETALIEAAYLSGPLSIQSEGVVARVKRPDREALGFGAFYVFVSYALTGEMRSYDESRGHIGRIVPKREIRDGTGGLGAFEIAFRLSHIDLDDQEVSGGKLNDFSIGFNWYPAHPTRYTLNIIRAKREDLDPIWIFQARLQLTF